MDTTVLEPVSKPHTGKKFFQSLLETKQREILKDWLKEQTKASSVRSDLINDKDLEEQSREFLDLFTQVLSALQQEDLQAVDYMDLPEYISLLDFLRNLSNIRVLQGFSPSETAIFIFSLKQPLINLVNKSEDKDNILHELWPINELLDKLGLYTVEEYQQSRERVIKQQQQELLELSTPVAKLWEGVLVLPLIGTLDSARTQLVMENLLQKIVETGSNVAIIDITGIPTVDTLVAQHLLKTMSAARLMGAECIVSGIRPQIAQTMIHLGISMQDVITKATLADAVALAMQKAGFVVSRPRNEKT